MNYELHNMGTGYMHYIELDSKTVKRLTAGGNKRVVCTLNNLVTLHAAVMSNKTGMYFISIASKYLKQLKIKTGSIVNAEIKIDMSDLQFNVPEEFTEVLNTDIEAKEIFNGLTPGNKRGLVALVNMVKSSDKKIERALLIAEKIKRGITKPQLVMQKIL
jgi:hypothetical protein